MKRVLGYLKPYKIRLILSLLIKSIETLVDLAIPYILSYIVDDVIPRAKENNDIKEVLFFGFIM